MRDVIILAIAVIAVATPIASLGVWARRRARNARAPWAIAEHSSSDALRVYLERPGEQPWLQGVVKTNTPDRGAELARIRSEAEWACAEANAGRLKPRRK